MKLEYSTRVMQSDLVEDHCHLVTSTGHNHTCIHGYTIIATFSLYEKNTSTLPLSTKATGILARCSAKLLWQNSEF